MLSVSDFYHFIAMIVTAGGSAILLFSKPKDIEEKLNGLALLILACAMLLFAILTKP